MESPSLKSQDEEEIIEIIYNDDSSLLNQENSKNENDDDSSSVLTPFEETEEEITVEFDEDQNAIDQIRTFFDEANSIKSEDLNIENSAEVELNAYDKYEEKCFELNIPPIRALENVLIKGYDVLDLQNYKIDDENLFLICQTLIGPPTIKIRYLNLRSAKLSEKGYSAISELLELNYQLESLNLENCKIGKIGIEILKDGIYLSQGITYLNLSNCNLKDDGGVVVAKMLAKNDVCKSIDLSRNQLHAVTAAELSNALKQNITLEILNLKWNDLYLETESSVKLLNGLEKNKSLKELDLSWNGIIGNLFSKSLAKVFRHNAYLKKINLENNYLQPENFQFISLGIKNAKALEEIYIGNNYITPEMQLDLIKSADKSKNLKILSLGNNTWIETNVYNLAQDVMRKNSNLQIIFKDKLYPNPPESVDFKAIVIDRAKYVAMKPKKKKLKKDLGHFMIKLQENSNDNMKKDDFIQLIKDSKIKLDDDLIKHLIDEFSHIIGKKKVEQKVQIKEMSTYYLQKYPTEPPPPPKIKKDKKKKKIQKKQK